MPRGRAERRDASCGVAWELLLLAGLVAMLTCLLGPRGGVIAAPVTFSGTSESMVVQQTLLTGRCVDGSGTARNDLDEWTTSAGSCDRIVCHVEPSGNYTVTHSCRPIEPSENPDQTNCAWISNPANTYPDCCPKLSCSLGTALTTVAPGTCLDLADNSSCTIWQTITNNCTDASTSPIIYNYTRTFCNRTCGNC